MMIHQVQSVITLMQNNLGQDLALNKMAQHVHVTREHLCRIFKLQVGCSPAKYLKSLRMQRAKFLLETTCLSVKEIMVRVGVKDESHFVRDFALAYTLTPARYRELYLKSATAMLIVQLRHQNRLTNIKARQ